jgi:hypothetical protein
MTLSSGSMVTVLCKHRRWSPHLHSPAFLKKPPQN